MTPASVAERVRGALLGTLVGDALGLPYEGDGPSASWEDGAERVRASADRDSLVYSDDTQMAIALAEHCAEHPDVDTDALAGTFLEHYEDWRGYGSGTREVVARWRAGASVEDAARAVFPEGSMGNGAAMRVAPLGALWADAPQRLRAAARRSALPTHVHPVAVAGAVTQARAVALAGVHASFGPSQLVELLSEVDEPTLQAHVRAALELVDAERGGGPPPVPPGGVADLLGTDPVAHRSLPAALWAAASGRSFPEVLARAIALGGDADTIAAMAGAIVATATGVTGIPQEWLDRTENGPRGRDHVIALADRLASSPGVRG